MITHNINPVFLSIFGLDIRYYGLIYALGIILALIFMLKKAAEGEIKNLNTDKTYDIFIWMILSVVLGARIFYVLFYDLGYFAKNPLEILAIWNGGLSFHGGLVGAILAAYIFCRKNKIDFLKLTDIIIIPVAFNHVTCNSTVNLFITSAHTTEFIRLVYCW